ncbi:DUF2157 domain-containing protein [Streptomonospora nanhaiensis]|uniref:DUF2157 domain-containing protein n=1 Tax=Streptomonospora nanhaiensis TaxID=1323731 RepID=UPI001C395B98|nr:DUF2157 domain-containing protein [Streptomonospora nanhaiensis]MBV2366629.1 DUF2157 domain-containing protein [Streptomonospora nanhaiensis]
MSGTEGAHDEALRGLVERGVLSGWQADQVRAALAAGPRRAGARWTEVVGYIGGGLVLAGACALVGASWSELDRPVRVALLAALAVVAVAGALVMAGGPQNMRGRRGGVPTVRRRIGGVLLALASVLAAFAVGEALEYDGDLTWLPVLVGLAVAAAGYTALPSAVGQVAVWGMAAGLVPALIDTWWAQTHHFSLILGSAWIALGAAWAALAAAGVLAERRLGLGLGPALALVGSQFVLAWDGYAYWGYGATLAVAAACLAFYRWERSAVLLVFGVLGITVGLPELVWDLTDGAIGAAAVLLLAGAVLLVASWLGLRTHRRAKPAAG